MKKTLLPLCALLFSLSLRAQTSPLDFDQNDCSGARHHLFSELDSGYVCILDFIMPDCQPCVVATTALRNIHGQFQSSNPGKVRFYSLGFQASVTCVQMDHWATTNNFKHTLFPGDNKQVNYYGGMGMPTIVILGGGTAHKIYYKNLGYSSSQNTPIINAINLAISESTSTGTQEWVGPGQFTAFPNPFDDALSVRIQDVPATHVVLTDLAGREIMRREVQADTEAKLATGNLPQGLYLLALYNGPQQIGLRKVTRE